MYRSKPFVHLRQSFFHRSLLNKRAGKLCVILANNWRSLFNHVFLLLVCTLQLINKPMITQLIKSSKTKNAFYLSVNVFSTKVLIGGTTFTSPTGDGTATLRGHPSHAKD